GERGHDRRIESAAQVRADRNIRSKTKTGGTGQQLEQPSAFVHFRRVGGLTRCERRLPVALDGDPAVAPRQRVDGRQLVDPLEDRSRRDRRPEREDVIETEWIDLARHTRMREQRLDLGGEQQLIVELRVKQRAYAETIA